VPEVSAPQVGIDVIEIERLERALARRPRLADRLFTPAELEFAAARRRPARHLAARFAAKEAAVKALGLGGQQLREVEIAGGGSRPPRLLLHGAAAEAARCQGVELSVSLTHSREIAAAVVVSTGRA
jgi:holo-[acyl-carrier protein] synthase